MKSFKYIYILFAAVISLALPVNSIGLQALVHDRGTRGKKERTAGVTVEAAAGTYTKLGISFEKNHGQAPEAVKFLSRSGEMSTYFTRDSVWFYLTSSQEPAEQSIQSKRSVSERSFGPDRVARRIESRNSETKTPAVSRIQMQFEGALMDGGLEGETELAGKVNYLRGSNPSNWVTDVPTFAAVRYREVYAGVDVVYYDNGSGQMEYDFQVSPGADPGQIKLKFSGAESTKVDEQTGDLVISTGIGELRHHRPIVFQDAGSGRREVAASYRTSTDGDVVFQISEYDRDVPLTIDPVVGYSTYLGGSGNVDYVNSIAVDSSGNAYLAGSTNSANFPTVSPFDGTIGGGEFLYDAFITKINAAGTAIVYSTYFGGSGDDNGVGIAIDAAGQVLVAGFTDSNDLPIANPFQNTRGGGYDAFVAKLNTAGSALVFSTYLGGPQDDGAYSVAVDSAGSAYITGETASMGFPVLGPLQPVYGGGGSDGFVAKFNPTGSSLAFSTFLGGVGDDIALDVAVNASGVYLTGATTSNNFPVSNAAQGSFGGGGFFDAFITGITPSGSSLIFSTFLGGGEYDLGNSIALGPGGDAFVTGSTASTNFPVVDPLQPTLNGTGDDVFITRINTSGNIVYSTYLGGTGDDMGAAIAVDANGTAYITGSTFSTNFPTVDAIQPVSGGDIDAFATKINPAGSELVYSTYAGGASFDDGLAIALDPNNNAYIAGGTDSANFPLVDPLQNVRHGSSDAFVFSLITHVSISGQVFTSDGRALRGAIVSLTDQTGVRRQVQTSSLGFFSFNQVPAAQPYNLSVASKRYRFASVNLTPTDSFINVNFTGLE